MRHVGTAQRYPASVSTAVQVFRLIFLRSTGRVFFGLVVAVPLCLHAYCITWSDLVFSLMSFGKAPNQGAPLERLFPIVVEVLPDKVGLS